MDTLGQIVKAARQAKGLTQAELGKLAGMATSSVGMLESGRVDRPFPETLRKLSKALGLTMEELVAATGQLEPPSVTPDDISQERIEAEVHRIAAIPGTQAKMDALMQLSPALFELVEGLVYEVIQSSGLRPTRSAQRPQENGTHQPDR